MNSALAQQGDRLASLGWKIPLIFLLLLALFLTVALANGIAPMIWVAIPFAVVGFLVLAVRAPEIFLVASVFVPQWKGSWPFSSYSNATTYLTVVMLIGLTIGLAVLCLRIILRIDSWTFERVFFRQKHAFALFAVFCAIVALSYTYTDAPSYGASKLARLALIGGLLLLAPLLLFRSEKAFRRFSRIFVTFGLLTSLQLVVGLKLRAANADTDITRIGAGWLLGMALFLVIFYGVFEKTWLHRLAFALSLPFLSAGLVASAARGALVAFVLILPFGLFIGPRERKRGIAIATIALGVCALGAFFFLRGADPAKYGAKVGEMIAMAEGKSTRGSAANRIPFYVQTAQVIPDHAFLGTGVGSWAVFYYGNDARAYPHNLLLEITFEEGVVGLAAFFVFFASIAMTSYRTYQVSGRHFSVVPIIVFYGLTVAMFSGDLDDNRLLWLWAGVALATCRNAFIAHIQPAHYLLMNYSRAYRSPQYRSANPLRPSLSLRRQPRVVQDPRPGLSTTL